MFRPDEIRKTLSSISHMYVLEETVRHLDFTD